TIARSLRLNEDLAEATALGHDLGHTPFGHAGEHVLNGLCPWGFKHNEHGIRVVDQLEGDPDWGLNLTQEVKDGILNHVWAGKARTLEGRIVRIADRTAYINHDIEDAIRGRILSPEQLPKTAVKVLGITSRERINTMITDIIAASRDREDILMSSEIAGATDELHRFMFENVYIDSSAKTEENKAKKIVGELYRHFLENPADLPEYNRTLLDKLDTDRVICDYIAGMTDRFAIKEFERLYIPLNWGY
ncbi:MAG TPA: deoxyguanosinetriphosphate triphosphohydrolase, partial [Clostridiales bacterium]|nr:deoxyguanosinetriphosphate triphosphohydrolase [Clostridiales bacterium]